MKIGVISDTHDRDPVIKAAVEILRERGVELVLHCGDIQSARVIPFFAGMPMHFVRGNWDYPRDPIATAIAAIDGQLYEPYGELVLEDKSIAWLHSHDRTLFRNLTHSDLFDFIFYGHTHEKGERRVGKTRIINPGALFRAKPKTVLIVDLTTDEIEWVTVAE